MLMPMSLVDSSLSVSGGYHLEIVKQNSLAQEKVAKNGVQKNVHIVVKNTPFVMLLQLHNNLGIHTDPPYDLSRLIIEARLLYDCEEEKEVGFVKAKPMEYKCHVIENNLQCHVELRIKVLSSQLEDMFFRVQFRAIDSVTNTTTGITALSEPIKVISKPDQLKKKPPKPKKRPMPSSSSSSSSTTPNFTSTALVPDPAVIDTLVRIEQQQIEQQKLLQRLLKQSSKKQKQDKGGVSSPSLSLTLESLYSSPNPAMSSTSSPSSSASSSSFSTSSSDNDKLEDMKLDDKDEDTLLFEESFNNFLRAYLQLNPADRSIKIRRLVRNTPARDVETLSELLDIFWTEGLQKDMRQAQGTIVMDNNNNNECLIHDCPHRRELEKIDEFYKDFLANTAINF